jgi:hypothetical protein
MATGTWGGRRRSPSHGGQEAERGRDQDKIQSLPLPVTYFLPRGPPPVVLRTTQQGTELSIHEPLGKHFISKP